MVGGWPVQTCPENLKFPWVWHMALPTKNLKTDTCWWTITTWKQRRNHEISLEGNLVQNLYRRCLSCAAYAAGEFRHWNSRFCHDKYKSNKLVGLIDFPTNPRNGQVTDEQNYVTVFSGLLVDGGWQSVLAPRCSHTLCRSDFRGWQALSSGILTVAPCACCVNLCVYVCTKSIYLESWSNFYHCITLFVFSCLFCFGFLINVKLCRFSKWGEQASNIYTMTCKQVICNGTKHSSINFVTR